MGSLAVIFEIFFCKFGMLNKNLIFYFLVSFSFRFHWKLIIESEKKKFLKRRNTLDWIENKVNNYETYLLRNIFDEAMFGMSLPGGYISSLRNQAKEMLEVKRLAVEFTS